MLRLLFLVFWQLPGSHLQSLSRLYNLNHDANARGVLLAKHNQLRAQEYSSDMQEMVWDPHLADIAYKWASNCDANHSPTWMRGSRWNWVGENLWWWNGGYPDMARVVQDLYDEISLYDYYTGSCRGVCGHYTQIVWAQTCAMGCAMSYCNSLINSFGVNYGYYVVCNYGPGGNVRGNYPYRKGPRCTNCPSGCGGSLCASTCSAQRLQSSRLPQVLPPKPVPKPQKITKPHFPLLRDSLTSQCKDLDWECPAFARRGECHINPRWMFPNCKRSCGHCKGRNTCRDDDWECSAFAARGECQINPRWMRPHCPSSCGFC